MKKWRFLILIILEISINNIAFAQHKDLDSTIKSKVISTTFSTNTGDNIYIFDDGLKNVEASACTLKKNDGGTVLYDVNVASSGKSQFAVTIHWKTTEEVKRGDIMLARLTMRTISARQESGESVVYFYFQEANAPHTKSFNTQIGTGQDWKTFDIPFMAHKDMKAGEASIGLALGSLKQHLEITDVEILNFKQTLKISDLPETSFTYAGREADASWRKEALQRIEEIRTAPIFLTIIDKKGKPIKGAQVEIKMDKSDFIWGTAVNENRIAGTDSVSQIYRNHLKELFNTAVIENGLKAGGWAWPEERKMKTLQSFEWLNDNGFRQRGHNLVWPAWKFNPSTTKYIAMADSQVFKRFIKSQIYERMAYTKGRVIAWDVMNEYMHEKEFFQYLPHSSIIEWYQLAHELDPDAELFINEYAMLNCVQSPQNIQEYVDTIQSLRRKGAPITAIGIQGHVGRQPRNPEQVITDLDLIVSTGLPVQITEFDINTPDEELQADYMRDFLIAAYSHPIVTGISLWGFWEGAHWKPNAGLFRMDWTPKGSGNVWKEWVVGKWKTHVKSMTDRKGITKVRGHLGEYKIKVKYKDIEKVEYFHLSKEGKELVITL